MARTRSPHAAEFEQQRGEPERAGCTPGVNPEVLLSLKRALHEPL